MISWQRPGADKMLVYAGVVALVALAWGYTLAGAGMGMNAFEMTAMTPLPGQPSMPMALPQWDAAYAITLFAMWLVMMIAMMLPSALPLILVYAQVQRKAAATPRSAAQATALFVAAYLLVWAGFSLAATLAQWLLASTDMLSPMLTASTPALAATLLIAAGLYQLTPLKHSCLSNCRSTMNFIATHWRPGKAGALRMGIVHGAQCLGCCWALMALLFVGGVMNLYWIAGLAVFVLIEKTLPRGHAIGYASGIALLAWGVVLLLR